jgi:hypothetical protein
MEAGESFIISAAAALQIEQKCAEEFLSFSTSHVWQKKSLCIAMYGREHRLVLASAKKTENYRY